MRKSNIFTQSEPALVIRDSILYEYGRMKNRHGCVVVSAEGLGAADYESAKQFIEHYRPYFEIQIIVFLRRQDYMAESSRAQAYRVNQAVFDPQGPFKKGTSYDFAHVLECWSNHIEKKSITVAEYPEQQGVQALKTLTFDLFNLPSSLEVDNKRLNERLGRDVLEYVFGHSNLVYGTKHYFKAIERLGQYSSQNPSTSKYRHFYSPQERLKIIDTHRSNNELVASRYKSDLFQSCLSVDIDEEWEPFPGLTKEQVADFDNLLSDITEED